MPEEHNCNNDNDNLVAWSSRFPLCLCTFGALTYWPQNNTYLMRYYRQGSWGETKSMRLKSSVLYRHGVGRPSPWRKLRVVRRMDLNPFLMSMSLFLIDAGLGFWRGSAVSHSPSYSSSYVFSSLSKLGSQVIHIKLWALGYVLGYWPILTQTLMFLVKIEGGTP